MRHHQRIGNSGTPSRVPGEGVDNQGSQEKVKQGQNTGRKGGPNNIEYYKGARSKGDDSEIRAILPLPSSDW